MTNHRRGTTGRFARVPRATDAAPVEAAAANVSVPIAGEARLIECIRRHTGLVMLSHQLAGLREAAHDTWQRFQLRGADHFCDLTNQAGGSASQALVFLLTRITVGESSFFRIAEHMAFLRNTWLPTIIERRRAEGKLTLRIWSAGRSTGEEIYTMALLLHEAIPDISRWRLTLLGTDINEDAVARARRPLSSVVAARHG